MAYTFDFTDKLIHVKNPQTDVDILDLYLVIRNAETSTTGVQYDKICDASGKESLGSGVAVGITLKLLEWQLKFWVDPGTGEGNYIAKIGGGNLVGGVNGDPIAYSAGVQTLLIQSAASTVVQVSTGSGLSAEQSDKLMALPSAATTATTVWAKGNAGDKLDFVHSINEGNWTLANDQMIFMDKYNAEIARYNLFDKDGNPTLDNAYKREIV
jgi:hypothetical protein